MVPERVRPRTFGPTPFERDSHVGKSPQTIYDAVFDHSRAETSAAYVEIARTLHGRIPCRQAGLADPVYRCDPDETADWALFADRTAGCRFRPRLGDAGRSRRQPVDRYLRQAQDRARANLAI